MIEVDLLKRKLQIQKHYLLSYLTFYNQSDGLFLKKTSIIRKNSLPFTLN